MRTITSSGSDIHSFRRLVISLDMQSPAQHDDGQIGVEVGVVLDLSVGLGVQGDLLENVKAVFAAKVFEIGDR